MTGKNTNCKTYRPTISRSSRDGQADNAAVSEVLSSLSILYRCNLLKQALNLQESKVKKHLSSQLVIKQKSPDINLSSIYQYIIHRNQYIKSHNTDFPSME